MRALTRRWAVSLDQLLADCSAPERSPLSRLRAVGLGIYADLDRPATASNQLSALAVDLQNAEMRELLHTGWTTVRRHLARHAAEAIDAGELVGCPPPEELARLVFTAMEGVCLAWSVHPEGSLLVRLAGDLDALLDPWTDRGGER